MSAQSLAEALGGGRKIGREYKAICPAHSDSKPSLDITEKGGAVLLNCRAGCSQDEVTRAIRERGLWDEHVGSKRHPRKRAGASQQKPEAVYRYQESDGSTLFEVVRYPEKKIRQRRPGPNGRHVWSLKGTERVLYRLPELVQARNTKRPVLIVEGEKDADKLAALGFVASTSSGGAGNWHQSKRHLSDLDGAVKVVFIPDQDGPGWEHVNGWAGALVGRGTVSSVRILILPCDPWRKGFDVSDWLANGGNAGQLSALLESAPQWTPNMPRPHWAGRAPQPDTPTEPEASSELAELDRRFLFVPQVGRVLDYTRFSWERVDAFKVRTNGKEWIKRAGERGRVLEESQLVFEPEHHDPRATDFGRDGRYLHSAPGQVNLFRGWAVEPHHDSRGAAAILDHITQVLCRGDEGAARWLVSWMAYPIQNPGAKMETAVAVQGPQGIGKSVVFESLRAIYGDHGETIGQAELEDSFNGWAARRCFILADEVQAASRPLARRLKGLITGTRLMVNEKGIPRVAMANRMNWVFLSNPEEGLPIRVDRGDRRYLALRTADALPGCADLQGPEARAYFASLCGHDGVGFSPERLGALLYLLQEWEIPSGFSETTKPPETGAKGALRQACASPPEQWFQEWREEQRPIAYEPHHGWDLYQDFRRFCEAEHVWPVPSRRDWALSLQALGVEPDGSRTVREGSEGPRRDKVYRPPE